MTDEALKADVGSGMIVSLLSEDTATEYLIDLDDELAIYLPDQHADGTPIKLGDADCRFDSEDGSELRYAIGQLKRIMSDNMGCWYDEAWWRERLRVVKPEEIYFTTM